MSVIANHLEQAAPLLLVLVEVQYLHFICLDKLCDVHSTKIAVAQV